MTSGRSRTQAGFSLAEMLVAALATVVLTAIAVSLLGSTRRASDVATPMAERTWTRASALSEMVLSIRDSAAKCAYFDLGRTVAAIHHAGGGASGPPAGFCLVVRSDPSTWPPGFDPDDRRTWRQITWWSGLDPDDPSTWYYACGKSGHGNASAKPGGGGGGPAAPISHELTVQPVASYGAGIRVGGGLEIVGPVAVPSETVGLGGQQVGEGLAVLRSEPRVASLRLGATLVTLSGVARFVARDAMDVAAVEGLRENDVLYVTGRDTAGAVRSAVVGVRTAPRRIRSATPSQDGNPIFQYFEAGIEAPGATLAGYLANTSETASGTEFLTDATVVVLARDGAVVTYYAARDDSGVGLYRVVGDPESPLVRERLLQDTVAGLRVQTTPVGSRVVTAVRVSVPVPVDDEGGGAEPLEAEVALLNATAGRKPVTVIWDAMQVPGGRR